MSQPNAATEQKAVTQQKKGTHCLVFGGSGALGREVCRTLAEQGARVAFTYHTSERVAMELASILPDALALPLDLTSVADIERTVDHVVEAFDGTLDAFVQCAGVAITMERDGSDSHHRMSDVDERGWERMMDINAKSTFFAVKTVSEVMRRSGGGNVVLLGSIDGVKPVPAPVHYAASKGALVGMTPAMAKELGEYGIRVNMIAPGLLEGGQSRQVPPALLEEYLKHCGLKRVGTFSEIAGLLAWLACENTYVTGQVILVDGAL